MTLAGYVCVFLPAQTEKDLKLLYGSVLIIPVVSY